MNALVFSDRASCDAFAAKVDASMGLPKPGVDIGDGIHVLPAQSITLRWADPIEHPTQKGTFAYPVIGVDDTKLAKAEGDAVKAAPVLTPDWFVATAKLAPVEMQDAKP